MQLKQETIDKLRELEKFILEEPRRFNLHIWGAFASEETVERIREEGPEYIELITQDSSAAAEEILESLLAEPPCGTVACLAGNLCIMAGLVKPVLGPNFEVYEFSQDTPKKAAEYLGVDDQQEISKLFFLKHWSGSRNNPGPGWPEEFEKKLEECTPGSKEYAQVAVDRIEHYIKTGE
jgi:hypothetical protein